MAYCHPDFTEADIPDGVTVIEMWPHEMECAVCEERGPWRHALPMYEGMIVDEDRTDEWAGFAICERCWDLNRNRLGAPIVPDYD